MKTHILILISVLILTGCHRQKRAIVTTNQHITIVDLLPAGFKLWEYDSQRRNAKYPVYYIGPVKDTIELNMPISPRETDTKDIDYDTAHPSARSITNLKLFVDTTFSTSHCFYHFYAEQEKLPKPEGSHMCLAYPVFVYNLSDSFVSLGMFNMLTNLVRQAKNQKGQWQDIETQTFFMCGTGARDIVAGPQQMIVAKLLRYKGDYFTECRLKLGRKNEYVYSNSFYDYIDKRQLTDTLNLYW